MMTPLQGWLNAPVLKMAFPSVVQTIVKILPTTWAMQGLLDLVLRGGGLVEILPEAGVLLGFAGIFFAVGVMRFRYE